MQDSSTFFKCLCFIFLNCFTAHLDAQNGGVANNWFFGVNAGVNFSTGAPVSIAGPISTNEGVSVISDINGNLLFSTDGITVYDRNNTPMPNGFGLFGDPSSSQSGVIVPNPASPTQFYIFTAAAEAGSFSAYDGIAYSIVDMTLNGGLGDVTIKNTPLVHPAAEKITAVKHCNGIDFWVICHEWETDAFYAYQLTPTGINPPVVSNVGSLYTAANGGTAATIGYLKASPNGKRLAAAIYNIPNNNLEVFDFDNITGVVSNPIYIPTIGGGYGIAFSPDNTKLYATLFSTTVSDLMQYDLTAANIPASAYTVSSGSYYGALQLGPNGKVYLSPGLSAFLDVVNNPNVAGAGCNYAANAVSLSPNSCNFGLPNFPDNLIYSNFSLGNDICATSATLDAGSGWVAYSWSTGATTQTINVTQTGMYWAQVTNSCGTVFKDTINVISTTSTLDLGNDITICAGSVILDAGPGANNYLWSTGATSQTISVSASGAYSVQKIEACGVLKDTIQVNISPAVISNVAIGQISCFGGTTTITVNAAGGSGGFQYSLYGTYQNSNVFTNVSGGLYSLLVKDAVGCVSATSVLVNEPVEITGHITSNGIACFGGVADIIASIHGGTAPLTYTLNGGAPQSSNNFSVPAGTYSVVVEDANGCMFVTNTLVVNEPPAIAATLSATTLPCFGDTSTLTVTASGGTPPLEYSLQGINYQNANTFQLPAGDYAVVIRDANGCIFLTNSLTIATPQAIGATLSATPIPCHNGTTNLSATAWNGTPPYLYSLNNTPYQSANNFPNLTGGNYTINVQDANGCISPNYNINIINPLAISILANADTACFGKTTVLDIKVSGGTGNLAVTLNGNPSPAQANVNVNAGNYTINVQDSNLCTATLTLNIPEYAPIQLQVLNIDSAYCNKANGAATILATGGSEGFTYTWFTNPAQYGANLQQAAKGTYSVRVQDAKGCRLDSSLKIPHILPPIAQFTSVPTNTTPTLSENEQIQFTAFTANAYSFSWSFGDGTFSDLQNPLHSFYNEGTYPVTLTAYDVHKECSANYTLIYNIEDFWNHFFIPNVFTPNGDTQFDKWVIESYPYESVTVKVFDRWGMDIFETNDLSKSWNGTNANGKACADGVYFYYVKVQNLKNESREFKGNVTLMR